MEGELIIVTDDSKITKMVPIVIPAPNQQSPNPDSSIPLAIYCNVSSRNIELG